MWGQKNDFKSKATEWGKTNEPVACQEYNKLNARDHEKLTVAEIGLFLSCENPVFWASPDAIVSCKWHKSGLLSEMKFQCPWTCKWSQAM